MAKDASKASVGNEATSKEASGGDAKAASITFSNLRNFSFQNGSNSSVDEDIQSDIVTESSADLEELEATTTSSGEVETSTVLGRDEKSLIGTFPFIDMGKMPKEIRNTMNTRVIVTMVGCVGSRCMG